ncbi:MAG: hypothetical protein IPH85_14335 [Ignavibacteria bacterium]|nr:hypothetical protein [Ignavibacteria bacterium]
MISEYNNGNCGEYTLLVESVGGASACANAYAKGFTIAVNRDMSTRGIRSLKQMRLHGSTSTRTQHQFR